MSEGMAFGNAIANLRKEYLPNVASPSIFIPSEEYRSLYETLDVIGKDVNDTQIQSQVKYIWDTLEEQGNPKDLIIDVITNLAIPTNETRLIQVWKYLRLLSKSNRILKYHNLLQDEINQMKKKEKV